MVKAFCRYPFCWLYLRFEVLASIPFVQSKHFNHPHPYIEIVTAVSDDNSTCLCIQYNSKVSSEWTYDCGVELTKSGMYGRPDYFSHATRGTLGLNSLYLLLWANFGAFSLGLLTQVQGQEKIISLMPGKANQIRHYCHSQLQCLWKFMSINLHLNVEERSYFVMTAMLKLLEVHL